MIKLKYTEEQIKEKIRIEENAIREFHKDKAWSWGAPESDGEVYRMAVRNVKGDIFTESLSEILLKDIQDEISKKIKSTNEDCIMRYPDGTPVKSKTVMNPGIIYCPYIPLFKTTDIGKRLTFWQKLYKLISKIWK